MSQYKLDKSPTQEVVSKVNHLGLSEAAYRLGVSKATLVRWLSRQGYKIKRVYVKEEAAGKPE